MNDPIDDPIREVRGLPTPPPRTGFWEELHAKITTLEANDGTASFAMPVSDTAPSAQRRRRQRLILLAGIAAALMIIAVTAVGLNRRPPPSSKLSTATTLIGSVAPIVPVTTEVPVVESSVVAPPISDSAPQPGGVPESTAVLETDGHRVTLVLPDGYEYWNGPEEHSVPERDERFTSIRYLNRGVGAITVSALPVEQTGLGEALGPPDDYTEVVRNGRTYYQRALDDAGSYYAISTWDSGLLVGLAGTGVDPEVLLHSLETVMIEDLP